MFNSSILLSKQYSLSLLTTFKIGGIASWFSQPRNLEELYLVLDFATKHNLPILKLGGGSNLLITDNPIDAMVIKLSSHKSSDFAQLEIDEDTITVGAAVSLPFLVHQANKHNLSGLQMLAGIPGSVGGGLVMNAGGSEFTLGKYLVEVKVLTPEYKIQTLSAADCNFSYRYSSLTEYFILSAKFKLQLMPHLDLVEESKSYKEKKLSIQPVTAKTAGCIFKNPSHNSAGKLLDQAGCKDMSCGGAIVSNQHANFIINAQQASFLDVLNLIELMQERVNKVHNVELFPEIKIWY